MVWKFRLAFLMLTASLIGFAADDDVKSLLNEAESALQAPAPTVRKKPRPVPKPKAESTEVESAPKAIAPETTRVIPIDNPDLQSILSVDLAAKERERANHFPKSVVRLSAGVSWLGNGYLLEKDDDTFEKIGGGSLAGGYLQYNPSWVLNEGDVQSLSLSIATGVGFFRGTGRMRRSGVQTGDSEYDLNLFPVDVDTGLVLSLWRKIGLQLSYGIGAEFLHQAGRGESDTTTQLFWGDSIQLALRGYFSESLEGFLSWKHRGLFLRRERGSQGELLMAGLGFQFAN